MRLFKRLACAAVSAALAISMSGCVMTVDQMYVPPRRSESYRNLQAVMDEFMKGLEYCAPITGENQQSVQMADLTGEQDPRYRKVRAIVNMFPGEGVVKVFFADTRKLRGARAAFDSRMIAELQNVLGEPNVVVK